MQRPGIPRAHRRLIAVGLVVAVSMFSTFVHLVNVSVERGDAMRQAVSVATAPR